MLCRRHVWTSPILRFNFTKRYMSYYTNLDTWKMRLISSYLFVLFTVVHVDIAVGLFLNNCPDKRMWNLRAKNMCGTTDKYMCLYDTNAGKFRELCKDKPEFHRPGNIFIISGNLQYFAARTCKSDRYQPHKWWTNGSSECQYLKSTCNAEGQVPYDNGTVSRDTKCRCDYTNYYTFVSSTRHKCFCDPTEEDCSCHLKTCQDNQVLTPDYDCVGIHAWTGQFVCPEYKAPQNTGNKHLQRRTTICPLMKQDFSGTIQQSTARIIHSAMFGVIMIIGICVVVYAIIKRSSMKDINMMKRELEAQDFYKIRLLKNYNFIVENIVTMDILWKMPSYIISVSDRDDIMSMHTQSQKTRTFLNILIGSNKRAYYSFLEALRKDVVYKEFADAIENTQVNDNESVEDFNKLTMESVPAYIKSRHEKALSDWREFDTKCVYTDAVLNLYSNILKKDFVTIIGTRRCGKSTVLHSVAVMLLDLDFEIIPCEELEEMIQYHNPYRKQVFVIDNCLTVRDFFKWNVEAEKIINIPVVTYKNVKSKIMISVQWEKDLIDKMNKKMPELPILLHNVYDMLLNDNTYQ